MTLGPEQLELGFGVQYSLVDNYNQEPRWGCDVKAYKGFRVLGFRVSGLLHAEGVVGLSG